MIWSLCLLHYVTILSVLHQLSMNLAMCILIHGHPSLASQFLRVSDIYEFVSFSIRASITLSIGPNLVWAVILWSPSQKELPREHYERSPILSVSPRLCMRLAMGYLGSTQKIYNQVLRIKSSKESIRFCSN